MNILAEVVIKGEAVTVEVLDVYHSSRGKVVFVKALTGQPFTAWTHGGWACNETATVFPAQLRNVRIPVELAAIPAELIINVY
jgi:hypothetical protein